jgi:hypothetical protein
MSSNNLLKKFWRQLRFDVPRMAGHSASRRRVRTVFLTVLLLIVIYAAVLGPFALFEYKFAGGIGGVAACAIMYGLAFGIRRWFKNRGNTIVLGINTAPLPSLRQRILSQRVILATVLNRAAFEMARQSDHAPDLKAGAVRTALLNTLRAQNLWGSLPIPVRDRLAAPEGSWTEEEIRKALVHLDAVAVLNWMLNPESDLASLRIAADQGAHVLRNALLNPDPVAKLDFLRTETDLRIQRGPAVIYFKRLGNELIKRGVIEGELEPALVEHAGDYMAYAASIGEVEFVAEDLPLGSGLVSEAPTGTILFLRSVASVRFITLEALHSALVTNKTEALEQIALSLA